MPVSFFQTFRIITRIMKMPKAGTWTNVMNRFTASSRRPSATSARVVLAVSAGRGSRLLSTMKGASYTMTLRTPSKVLAIARLNAPPEEQP
jgi:hypothetical protein